MAQPVMTRSEFEGRVDAVLGRLLAAFRFVLVPQPPAAVRDSRPAAIYETSIATFRHRLTGLAAALDTDSDHVDLIVEWADPVLRVELGGFDLDELLDKAGVPKPLATGPLPMQLAVVADTLARALPVFRD